MKFFYLFTPKSFAKNVGAFIHILHEEGAYESRLLFFIGGI